MLILSGTATAIFFFFGWHESSCHPKKKISVPDKIPRGPTFINQRCTFEKSSTWTWWPFYRYTQLGQSPDYITRLTPANHCHHFIPVLTAGRQSRRVETVVPRTNRKTADRAFSTAAPWAWNRLPTELKRTQSTSAFHRGLKTFLFNRTYCSE